MSLIVPSQAIVVGDISTYLVGNNNALGSLFGKRLSAPGSMVTIAMVTDALRFGYDGGAETEQELQAMANYLIWLCGSFGLQALSISGNTGGGAVVPGGRTLPDPIDWRVSGTAASDAPLATGETSVVLDGTNGMPDLRGYNVDFFRGGIPQYTTDPQDGSAYYNWVRTSGLFSVSIPAQLDEPMRISPIS
jgi:hypothetical protein